MRSIPLSLVLAAALASHLACERESADGFCGALDASPGCGGELETCRDKSAADKIAFPLCAGRQDALEACLAELELACEPGSDFNVYANGDGVEMPNFFAYIGSYRLNIRDTQCSELALDLESCRACGTAFGFESDLGGVGDPCGSESDCTDGLQCFAGGCTRACANETECMPKHGYLECTTVNGRINLCEAGMCTTYCHGNAYEIYACPPA